ncbi:MAG: DNA polymerase III subunit beta [Actinomycetota bacterium]
MKFVVSKKAFLEALKGAQPAVSRRSTLPILSGMKLDVSAKHLTIEATDLEMAVATRITRDVRTSEPGTIVAPAGALIKAVGALPDEGIEVGSEQHDGRTRVTLRCGSRTVGVQGFAAEDWPRTRTDSASDLVATADARSLADALGRVVLCASKDEARPVLTGVALFFDRKKTGMDLVATDSYRLGAARVQLQNRGEIPERPVIIPARTASALAKRLRKVRGTVEIHVDVDEHAGTFAAFTFADEKWSVRTIEGQFPDWRQILGESGGATLEFDAGEMASTLKAMAAVRSNGSPVRLSLGERCTVSLSEKDVGEVTESLGSASYTADGVGAIDVAFNADYFGDAIRFIGSERPAVRIRSALKPAIFEHPDRRYALMPVRLS